VSDLNWYGPQRLAEITRETERRLDASAILVLNRVRVLLSVSGTSGGATRDAQGRYVKGSGGTRRVYGATRSRPGEPPRKQRGTLRASYTWERSGLTARVGTNYRVARILELGSRRVAPRPHLRPAFRDATPAINALWARPMRLGV
jgi:phage gpG-like protein